MSEWSDNIVSLAHGDYGIQGSIGRRTIGLGTLGIPKYNCPKHGEIYHTIMIVKDNLKRNYCQICVSEMITPELIENAGIKPLEAKE